jgi:hypothetical protein
MGTGSHMLSSTFKVQRPVNALTVRTDGIVPCDAVLSTSRLEQLLIVTGGCWSGVAAPPFRFVLHLAANSFKR